jgi:sporulation protein YlmC with PRC-barrel domain
VRVSALLGLSVRTQAGERLGHVHDVRAELSPRTLKVTGLVVGRLGVLERLGIGAPTSTARLRGRDVIAWKDVVRADRRGVIVRGRSERE